MNISPTQPAPDEFVGRCLINGMPYRRPMIRVAEVTFDGTTCVVPLKDLIDTLGEDEAYTVRIKTMRKAEFDRMEEFQGW